MAKLTVTTCLTLDGVMQAPGGPSEDPSDSFKYGGWVAGYWDEFLGRVIDEQMAKPFDLLLGRKTYEDFYDVWPRRNDGNPFTDRLNNSKKYVASTTLKEPLPWMNSILLNRDVPAAIARLKQELDGDIAILGSGILIQSLMKHNLIDEYHLSIHPLVLGSGSRLFAEGSPFAALKLVDSKVTTTGVVIATYYPTSTEK